MATVICGFIVAIIVIAVFMRYAYIIAEWDGKCHYDCKYCPYDNGDCKYKEDKENPL